MSVRKNDPVDFAIEQFELAGYTYGSVVPREWFDQQFEIPEAQSVAEHQKNQILYASLLGEMRARLLVRKKMALRTKASIGQEVVHPSDQTSWAMTEAKNTITKELEKAKDRMMYVNAEALSDVERKENADAIAKLSFFSRRTTKELP